MKPKTIELNIGQIKSVADFHETMKNTFGFPDFYGKNIHALIDCLSSLRFPEDAMSLLFLEEDEYLLMEIKGYLLANEQVKDQLVFAVGFVNHRQFLKGRQLSIVISIS
ncbi:MAG: barstar family protein [Bacteroidia bacterium]|nr:barstar family protein [Bacteroidia bacterium]